MRASWRHPARRRCDRIPPIKLFADALHDEFASWALGFAPFGGADIGELRAIASRVKDGDDAGYYAAWSAAAQGHLDAARHEVAAGRHASAHEDALQAACLFGPAMHIVYGAPVDPRLTAAFSSATEAFALAMKTRPDPAEPLDVPLDGATMPAYFVPAEGQAGTRRPLVIMTNGYDATMADMYLAMAISASRRGFHCLLYDGPGQGGMLVEQGVPLRADWEHVIGAVLDAVADRPDVDPARIVSQGWSLGGYLALRAAAAEPRIAAVIADPPVDPYGSFLIGASHLGLDEAAVKRLPDLSDDDGASMMRVVTASRELEWGLVKRGFWVNGTTTIQEFVRSLATFTYAGQLESVRCPVLLTSTEGDPLSHSATALARQIAGPATVTSFTAAEGAGDHCELLNRSLANRRMLGWVEDTLPV